MNDHLPPDVPPDGDPDDELSYEDFDDDFVWGDPDDDLDVIDLDALDDPIVLDEDLDAIDADDTVDVTENIAEDDAEAGEDETADEDTDEQVIDAAPAHFARPPLITAPTERADQPTAAAPPPDTPADTTTDAAIEAAVEAPEVAAPDQAPPGAAAAEANTGVEPEESEPDAKPDREPDTELEPAVAEAPAEEPAAGDAVDAPKAAGEEAAAVTKTDTTSADTRAAADTAEAPGVTVEAPQASAAEAADAEAPADVIPPEPPPPDWVYHLLIALPDELSAQVLELRTTGDVEDMPPPGISLAGSFRTEALDMVEEQLVRWTRNHLPLQLEITGVLAEVVGQQQYVAAWQVQPQEDLHDAQHNLRRALAPLIQPLPGAPVALTVNLTIGDHVPPRRYPHVIGRMQHEFEPYVWHATDLLLVRRDADDPAGDWTIAQRYD